ncbi:hypothetical protein [Enterococcus faecalis]|uniref:hypothetical protein n=1 Tax=Enterococcus faecalis TaxID=1351 RepID=UPI00313D5D6C
MSQVVDFLNEAKTFYFATVEGDQPRVRPFNAAMERNGKVYLGTTNQKKFISSYWQIQRWKSQVWQKENGFGSPAKP